jgi:hypothetical protein
VRVLYDRSPRGFFILKDAKKESVQRSSLVRGGKWDQRVERASNSATFQLLAPKVEKLARCDELAINPLSNPLFEKKEENIPVAVSWCVNRSLLIFSHTCDQV